MLVGSPVLYSLDLPRAHVGVSDPSVPPIREIYPSDMRFWSTISVISLLDMLEM